jgi:hypothetical protein
VDNLEWDNCCCASAGPRSSRTTVATVRRNECGGFSRPGGTGRLAPLARQVAQITENLDRLVRRKAADAEAADTSGADEPWDESVI